MLLFRSEEHVDRWCRTRGLLKRPLVTLDQLWQLAMAWYGNRLTVESRRPAGEEVQHIFRAIGLEGPFWQT
jgi:hypothetical protein